MNKEKLLEFLNQQQQNSIKDYQYFDNNIKLKKGDYVKFMYKYNYQFMEGGIVVDVSNFPVIRLKSYEKIKNFYNIDTSKVYLFYKPSNNLTRRQFFEQMLTDLENGKLNIKKSN
jgi:hypothetical protein